MAAFLHINEVHHDKPAHIPQSQLPCHFFSRFKVGVIGGFLNAVSFCGLAGVDINGDQGFGLFDHQKTTGFKRHLSFVNGRYLILKLVFCKNGFFTFEQPDNLFLFGCNHSDEVQNFFVGVWIVNEDFCNICCKIVP